MEREQRARRYHEQQLQERKKKLLEQRLKEERRRAAVEEKRRQRLKEEKVSFDGGNQKLLFLVRPVLSQLWMSNINTEACFPELRSDMNLQCVGHWRRAKGPSRTSVKTQEEGSSPRTVSRDECAFLFFPSLLTHSFLTHNHT